MGKSKLRSSGWKCLGLFVLILEENVFDDRVWAEKEFEWVELILIVDDKYQNVGISSNDSILEIGDWGQPIFSHPKSLLWKEWGETKFTFIKCME